MAALRAVQFLPHVKEIRIHLCQKSDASKGVRYNLEIIFYLNMCSLIIKSQTNQITTFYLFGLPNPLL